MIDRNALDISKITKNQYFITTGGGETSSFWVGNHKNIIYGI